MPKKKLKYEIISGRIWDLGSIKKNKASVLRKLRNRRFKGRFIIKVCTTPKIKGDSVKFQAQRKIRR